MLKLEKLTKKYIDEGKKEILAVNNVTYKYKDKGLVLIKGKSGSGKTTLLNLISSNDYPTSGSVYFNDLEISNKKEKLINQYKKQIIGYVFQDHNLLEDYTVYENIEFALSIQGKSINEDEVIEYLEKVELKEEYLDKYPDELSGGEQQRVAILRALMKDSKIILADEPTSALDSETKSEIYKILKEISKDKLVILSSHDYENIEEYADVVLKMENGILIEEFNNNKVIKETNSNELEEVKTKISFKYFFKNYKNFFLKEPIRLVIMFILILLSYTITNMSIGVLTVSRDGAFKTAIRDNIINEISFEYRNEKGIEQEFNNKNFNDLTVKYPNSRFIKVYKKSAITWFEMSNIDQSKKSLYYNNRYSGYISLQDNRIDELGLKLLSGKLPQKNTDKYEVLISKYAYEHYKEFGYTDAGVKIEINTYDDLIGKKVASSLKGKKIVVSGIVDTGSNYEKYSYAKNLYDHYTDFELDTFKKYGRDLLIYGVDDFNGSSFFVMSLTKEMESSDFNAIISNKDYYIKTIDIQTINKMIERIKDRALLFTFVLLIVVSFSILLVINQTKNTLIMNSRNFRIIRSLGQTKKYIHMLYLVNTTFLFIVLVLLIILFNDKYFALINRMISLDNQLRINYLAINNYMVIGSIIWFILILVFKHFIINKRLKMSSTMTMNNRE